MRPDPKAFLFSLDRKMICKQNGKKKESAIEELNTFLIIIGGGNGDIACYSNCNTHDDNWTDLQ